MNVIPSITGHLLLDMATYSLAVWPSLTIITWLGCRLWDWVDDKEGYTQNPLINRVYSLLGWKKSEKQVWPWGKYYKEKSYKDKIYCADSEFIYISISLILPAMFVGIYLYQITLPIVIGLSVLYVFRFVRRLQKAFTKHIEDKDAHK